MHVFLTVSRSWNNNNVLLIARKILRRYLQIPLLYLSITSRLHLSRIRNVFISIELIFISLIFLASGGECIKDKDAGVRLSTWNLLKSLCTFTCRKRINKLENTLSTLNFTSILSPKCQANTFTIISATILAPKLLTISITPQTLYT